MTEEQHLQFKLATSRLMSSCQCKLSSRERSHVFPIHRKFFARKSPREFEKSARRDPPIVLIRCVRRFRRSLNALAGSEVQGHAVSTCNSNFWSARSWVGRCDKKYQVLIWQLSDPIICAFWSKHSNSIFVYKGRCAWKIVWKVDGLCAAVGDSSFACFYFLTYKKLGFEASGFGWLTKLYLPAD